MTAGSARHYRVSAINPAGTGPASNVATATPATVRNRGDGPSAVTTLRYYRSADSSISSSNTQVGTDPVNGLAASGSSPESISRLTAPATAGTYYMVEGASCSS